MTRGQPDWSQIKRSDTLNNSYRTAAEALNMAAQHYRDSEAESDDYRKLVGLYVQASMLNFDLLHEMSSVVTFRPEGLALQAALRGVILRCVEFKATMYQHLEPTARTLAQSMGLTFDATRIRTKRKELAEPLRIIESWRDVRNKVGGHYDPDVKQQLSALDSIDYFEVYEGFKGLHDYTVAYSVAVIECIGTKIKTTL